MLKDAKYPAEMKEREQISNELNRFNVNENSKPQYILEWLSKIYNHHLTPENTADKDISDQQSSKQICLHVKCEQACKVVHPHCKSLMGSKQIIH